MEDNYDDIINLPHHVSKNRPKMSLYKRAAQFMPFMAGKGNKEGLAVGKRVTQPKEEIIVGRKK